MGVNSNFDNSFLQPSLPPPQAPLDENVQKESFKEKKALQRDSQGNVIREKERVHSDGSQSYSETTEGEVHHETEVHEQEHGDEGGQGQGSGGQGGDGSGKGSSSGGQSDKRGDEGVFSFQEALDQLVGKGKVSEGREVGAGIV